MFRRCCPTDRRVDTRRRWRAENFVRRINFWLSEADEKLPHSSNALMSRNIFGFDVPARSNQNRMIPVSTGGLGRRSFHATDRESSREMVPGQADDGRKDPKIDSEFRT